MPFFYDRRYGTDNYIRGRVTGRGGNLSAKIARLEMRLIIRRSVMTALSILLFMSQGWTVTPEEELEGIAKGVASSYSEYRKGTPLIMASRADGGYYVEMSFEFKRSAVDCDVAFRLARDYNVSIWRSKPRIAQTDISLFYYSYDGRYKQVLLLCVGRPAAMRHFSMWTDPDQKPTGRGFIRWVAENRHVEFEEPRNNTDLSGFCIQ